jgi:hypothetical protein
MSVDKVPPSGAGRPAPLRQEQLDRTRESSSPEMQATPRNEAGTQAAATDEAKLSPEGRELARAQAAIPEGTLGPAELRQVLQWLEAGAHRDPAVLDSLARRLAAELSAPDRKPDGTR